MASKTDELVKPDMRAVLERTHLREELNDFLLPVFEAVSNAIHGIETRFSVLGPVKGRIHIPFDNPTSPQQIQITVTDNGVGLNAENYSHFKVPFSGHKLQKHGRGFGRFIAFKVFRMSHTQADMRISQMMRTDHSNSTYPLTESSHFWTNWTTYRKRASR